MNKVIYTVYDGWNCVVEKVNRQSAVVSNCYVWGMDLSGSLQGAGGIGGLVCAKLGTNAVYYTYDGNGNVSELISTNGAIAGHYEYLPFGGTVALTGSLAKENAFRFSTKYADEETGFYYYGYRHYQADTGRWISRDPIGEEGSLSVRQNLADLDEADHPDLYPWKERKFIAERNLYLMASNRLTDDSDFLGLFDLNVNCTFQQVLVCASKCQTKTDGWYGHISTCTRIPLPFCGYFCGCTGQCRLWYSQKGTKQAGTATRCVYLCGPAGPVKRMRQPWWLPCAPVMFFKP